MKKQVDLGLPGSDSAAVGDKRRCDELGEKQESARKRGKLRDLHFEVSSEEVSTNQLKIRRDADRFKLAGETSHLTNEPAHFSLDASQAGKSNKATEINRPLDLNSDVSVAYSDKCAFSGGIGLDLNADVMSSLHHSSFNSSQGDNHMKLRPDASECGSTTGPTEEKDSLRVWKEMKENGFLSSSSHGGVSIQSSLISSIHGGIPVPKQRGRKSKSDVLKKRMELAKKEQVDRFTRIAAPSGLLNGLNPGIINHVRNKKQVHSIIEALVRSEKDNHVGHAKHQMAESKQIFNAGSSGNHQYISSQGSGIHQMGTGSHTLSRGSLVSQNIDNEALALRLSSTKEDSSAYSNEESTNGSTISCLSVRAASVASQWLELLQQDISGRLSALKRSRKRVRAVITTELPFLLSKEFSSNQENDPTVLTSLFDGQSNDVRSAMHQSKWSALFDQMDKSLAEEEKQLEIWLNKVKEMQLHCDSGLQSIQWNTNFGFLHHEASESCTRTGKANSSEKDLAVRAAAASIYSTCSFLMSKENVSCF